MRFTVDCHVHSRFSPDSHAEPKRIVEWALRRRLDAIALSDHDTMSGIDSVRRAVELAGASLTIIPAVEITTERRTHLVALYIQRQPQSRNLVDVADEIHDLGGLVVLVHPYRRDTGLLSNLEDGGRHTSAECEALLERTDLIELSNAKSTRRETDRLIRRLPELPTLPFSSGSDAHVPFEVGRSYLEVTDLSPAGLRAGGTVVRREFRADEPVAREATLGERMRRRVPAGAKAPWRALKRELIYHREGASELDREASVPCVRWRREPSTGDLVELVVADDAAAEVAGASGGGMR
jgi:predicted metal-dependent phosphoesterase TrpH